MIFNFDISIVFSIISAVLWLIAALIPFKFRHIHPEYGEGYNFRELDAALKKQSYFNAAAAIATAIAVLMMAFNK